MLCSTTRNYLRYLSSICTNGTPTVILRSTAQYYLDHRCIVPPSRSLDIILWGLVRNLRNPLICICRVGSVNDDSLLISMDHEFHSLTGQSNLIAPSQPSIDSTSTKNGSDPATEDKLRAIRKACKIKDLEALAALATSPLGFVSDEVRQETCRLVLGFGYNNGARPTDYKFEGRYYWVLRRLKMLRRNSKERKTGFSTELSTKFNLM